MYPIWKVKFNQDYGSLVEALLEIRQLDRGFLQTGADQLHDPMQLHDMDCAVDTITRSIRSREHITVFGDYDVDGVSSTALMLDFLESVDASHSFCLPDRHIDGYGLKPHAVEKAIDDGTQLIVTVDNGISAFDGLKLAQENGIKVVVTDHHKQIDCLPVATAIVNPNKLECAYPFKGLSGAGVAFKLVQALSHEFLAIDERRSYLNNLLDLVALGTIADVMPVIDENRILIRRGLQIINREMRPGIRQLKAVTGNSGKQITAKSVAFQLAPRINVAGRLEKPDMALNLLRSRTDIEATKLAKQLNDLNLRRQDLQREATDEIESLITQEQLVTDRLLVVLGQWPLGIIGILAGRLKDRFMRPVVVCAEDVNKGLYVGSARSFDWYDIGEAIGVCAEYLENYGGHSKAAGFSLRPELYESFRVKLLQNANEIIDEDQLQAELKVDMELAARDLDITSVQAMAEMEPFGEKNEMPIFAIHGCKVIHVRQIGRGGAHLKISLEVEGRRFNALWWNRGNVLDELNAGLLVSIAFKLEEDTYAGRGNIQLVLEDMYIDNPKVSI